MENPIKQVFNFNEKAGLLNKGYNARLEAAFQIEEALEGFNIVEIAHNLGATEALTARDLSRYIINQDSITDQLPAVEALDKACDSIVYAIGSIAKLGLDVQGITKALNIVMSSNQAKLNNAKYDNWGKLLKNPNFVGPEAKLQALLVEKGL